MNFLQRAVGRISYRAKIMLCYFVVVSIPFSAGVLYLFNTMVTSARANTIYSVEQRIDQEFSMVEKKLEDIRQTSYYFSTNSSLNQFFTPNFYNDLQLVEAMNSTIMPIISWMEAAAAGTGGFRFFTSVDLVPETRFFVRISALSDECRATWLADMVAGIAKNGYYFEPAHPARSFQYSPQRVAGQVFCVSYPLPATNRFAPTYLQMDITPAELFGGINQTPVMQTGFFGVLSDDGTDITENLSLLRESNAREELLALLSESAGSGSVTAGGREYFLSSRRLEPLGSTLLCLIPMEEINSPSNKAKFMFAGIVFCSTVLILLLSSAVSGMLLRRIQRMRGAVHKMQLGDFKVNIPVSGSDEIDELAESINTMSFKINELINTVYRAQMRQKEAELLALQAQINPHFLFNTLETFRMMAELENLEPLADGVASLGRLMRYSFSMNQSSVTLKTELQIAASYLKIQNLMHNGRISLVTNIPSELLDLTMPALIIQPLIENSILHGLGSGCRRLQISISAELASCGGTELFVSDDGLGANPEKTRELVQMLSESESSAGQKSPSIGLWNVNSRLTLAFGEQSSLRLSASECGGFCVSFIIPKTTEKGEAT